VLHFGDLRVEQDDRVKADDFVAAFRRHRGRLANGIAVIDERGTHAVGRVVDQATHVPAGEWISIDSLQQLRLPVHLTYTTTGPPRFLTLRTSPESELGRVPWQAGLAVRVGDAPRRSIRLTSGGNAETIALDAPSSAPVAPADASPASASCKCGRTADEAVDRFREILADVATSDDGLLVRISVPVPVLETWERIARANGDVLTADERNDALPAATERVAQRVTVIADGRERVGDVVSSRFAPADDPPEDAEGPSCVWTTRLVTELQFPTDAPGENAVIHWSLFNSAVLRARALLHGPDVCCERLPSTYEPMVWTARSDGR
jgi:hypothetical protein